MSFQSTPSVWRETTVNSPWRLASHISIHSLRMEGDASLMHQENALLPFQSTPSVWRETDIVTNQIIIGKKFQSTPSVWRETFGSFFAPSGNGFQSTPSVWRETVDFLELDVTLFISIHSLRMEGDTISARSSIEPCRFQSTPSVWRETFVVFKTFY